MYHSHGIQVGPNTTSIEADGLREAWDEMGHLYSLHKDALFLEAHVRFFYDVEPEVVPKSRDDAEGYQYRGFECLRTGCNITFKETDAEGGLWPGRFCAYINGDDKPKLYDPKYDPEEILSKLGPDTAYVRQFGANIGEATGTAAQAQQGPPPGAERTRTGPPPSQQHGGHPNGQAQAASQGNGGSEKTPFNELSPKRKMKRVEGQLKSLDLSERPHFISRLAAWRDNLPPQTRSMLDDIISEYATDDAYDARMVEMDTELHEASGSKDKILDALEEAVQEVATWPPQYREAARAMIAEHAPSSFDVGDAITRATSKQPA